MSLFKCIMTGICHYIFMQSCFTVLKILFTLSVHPPPQTREPQITLCLHSFKFLKMLYGWHNKVRGLLDWLLSVSKYLFKFFHVFAGCSVF